MFKACSIKPKIETPAAAEERQGWQAVAIALRHQVVRIENGHVHVVEGFAALSGCGGQLGATSFSGTNAEHIPLGGSEKPGLVERVSRLDSAGHILFAQGHI